MSTHASNIRTVLDALAASEFAARVRVFGSVMKGDQTAGDVDCVIDCDGTWDPAATFHRKYDGGGAIHSPLSSPAFAPLLDLAGDRSLCGSNGRHLLDLHVGVARTCGSRAARGGR